MTKLRQAAWTAIHKINRSTGFDEESDILLMEAASVLREALAGQANNWPENEEHKRQMIEGRRKWLAKQAEQEQFDMDDHPPHRLCECRKCMEYFTPLPDCDAFAASGKPIAEQTNTQFMEGYRIGLAEMREKCAKVCADNALESINGVEQSAMRKCAAAIRTIKFEGDTGFRPVSEMIAEHKQDPKKAAAIEKAKMRKAERKPVAWVDLTKEELHQIEMTCETSAECYRVIAKALKDRNYAATIQQAEQEPVAWILTEADGTMDFDCQPTIKPTQNDYDALREGETFTPLYAAPVRTKDLTDDEIAIVYEQDEHHHGEFNYRFDHVSFARAVIAADRSKNEIV